MPLHKIRLRTALYGIIFLASILPAIVLAPWLAQELHTLLLKNSLLKEEVYHKEVSVHLNLEAKRLTSVLEDKADPIGSLLQQGKLSETTPFIEYILRNEPNINTITIYDQNAHPILHRRTGTHTIKELDNHSPAIAIPMRGRAFLGSPSTLSDGHYEFIIAVPVFSKGISVAVLVCTVNINELWQSILRELPTHESMVYLVDGRGRLMNTLTKSKHLQGDLLSDQSIVRSLLAKSEWHQTEAYVGFENETVFGIGTLVDNLQWGIVSEVPEAPIMTPIIPAIISLSLIIILLHVFFGIISVYFARFLLLPIDKLIGITNRAAKGDYTQKVDVSGYHEIVKLSKSFNTMIHEINLREITLQRMHHAMNGAADAILITNAQGVIEYANHAFTTMTGFSNTEILGSLARRLIYKSNQAHNFYKLVAKEIFAGKTWSGEMICSKKDGSTFPASMSIAPVFEGQHPTHYIAIQQDISRQRQLELQLQQSQKMEAVGNLAGGIAHDFNNLLAGITGNLYLAKNTLQKVTPNSSALTKIETAEKLCAQAAKSVAQLLAFARQDRITYAPICLNDVLNDALSLSQFTISEFVVLRCNIEQTNVYVLGDHTQVEQVILNILNNASYALKGLRTPEINILLTTQTPNTAFLAQHSEAKKSEYTVLTISDNGSGIPKANLAEIFNPFFTTKTSTDGTGLGLSMVYGTMKSLGGFVLAESEEGIGTIFSLYFPIVDDSSLSSKTSSKALPEVNSETPQFASPSLTILLADDEDEVRTTTACALEDEGHTVIQAVDGADALEKMKQLPNTIDIALLDAVMPYYGGIELGKKLRKISPQLPLLFITGYDKNKILGKETLSKSIVLTKPVQFDVLFEQLKALMNS